MQVKEFYSLIHHIETLNRIQAEEVLPKMRETYNQMDDQNLSLSMFKLSEHIMRLKAVNPQIHDFLQQCIKDIIKIAVNRKFLVGTEALRNIFNTDAQFYKHSRLDIQSRFPLGYRHPLKNYQPQEGQQCDIVKPYISSMTYCGWTRGIIIAKEGKKYLVKYANSQVPSDTKQQPFCAPLGTRTEDFEWRMNLNVGDQVDAYHKVWYTGTVAGQQLENGTKRVRVTFKVNNPTGSKIDKYGDSYDGLDDQQDQLYDITSYRIQKPGTMAKKFCTYSLTSQEFVLDDTYDLIFRKQYEQTKFRSIMRLNFTRSQSFLEFYETFCECAGNETFLDLLENYNKENIDYVFNAMIVLANSSFLVPRMGLNQFLPEMLNKVVKFLFDNSKTLNPHRNEMASFFIDVVAKRIMSLSEKHLLVNEIRKRLTLDFLKMNMEKQMIALRLLYELINPMPRKYSLEQKKQVDEYLLKNDIFYKIIQPNTHEQILLRAVEFIKYLLQNQIISFKQIEYLWNIYPPTDLRGKATVEKMIGEISKTFSLEDTKKVITKILSYKESQLTVDNLTLLRSLKDHKELQDEQRLKILQCMWEIITLKSMNLTESTQEEVEKVFNSIVPSLVSNEAKLQLLKLILARLQEIKTLRNQFDILKQFILTYPKKLQTKSSSTNDVLKIQDETQIPKDTSSEQREKIPSTIGDVVEYLKQKNIYQTIINLFNQLKNQQKMKNVLWFASFLFQHDKDNVNHIVKVFYDKMGPTDFFFDWAQYITSKSEEFFVQFFDNIEDMQKFQQLSIRGFEALKTIIFDVNITAGNLKLIKKVKAIGTQSQSSTATETTSTPKGPIYGPTQKPQTLTFLYLLKSPYQCKGVRFLQQLLCVVKNSKVYDEIIKMIIQFFVNLDDSIVQRTKEFREQFLMEIIEKFKNINQKNQYNQKIKVKLEMNVGLLQQLFAETEKEGLLDIKPHFQCVEGEIIKLTIENHLTNNKIADPKIEISQNATLWTLKTKIAEILKEKPQELLILKFTTPISDELNAKSIADLHFYNKESVKVQRKTPKEIPRKQLLTQTGQALTPRFASIVQKWFHNYKNQKGQMGMQQLKNLATQQWRGSALRQTSKLQQIIQKFDTESKAYVNLEEFKQFFIFKSAQNSAAVWKIINLSGYFNNLKRKQEQDESITADSYPRRILSTPRVYEVIFSILENPTLQPVHLNFYRLLALLQTDSNLKQEVKKNAKSLIEDQQSLYKLSYILETILSQILVNNQFYVEFYRVKGCQFIFSKLISFMSQQKSVYTFDTLTKTIIMPNMIKILNCYEYCLHSENKLHRYLRRSKINHIQLDFLSSQVKKIDQVVEDNNQFQDRLKEISVIEPSVSDLELLKLGERILLNLVENFNNQLLQKLTNQVIRLYSLLSIALNYLNTQLIIKGLKCESLNYRRSCQNIAYLYLIQNQSQVNPFLQLLLSNLPQQSKPIYSYFFTLLEKVLEIYLDMKKDQKDDTEFIQLTEKLFHKLFNQMPSQNRNAIVADKLLLGVLVVINVLLTKREGVRKHFKHMKKELLEKCLFFYHPKQRIAEIQVTPEMLKTEKQANHFNDYVKCKSQDTRKVLMEIIFHLHEVSAQEDPLFIDEYILPIFNDLPKQKRKFQTKSLQVGLSNLGSTCYMNSMLQVLNSVTPFRNLIMQSHSQAPLVKQLQHLFAHLYYSERQDYIPEQLLKAFVPPIQKGIQQDTTEFLNILLDQLDKCLKGTKENNLLEEIFQGTQATQMICHACGQKRQREETFFTYSVEIEGKYDLNSALQGMNVGEVISDCACEYCGQRSDTTKRTIIETIPNLFFVPLKRIVFNYDVFMNTKIHTRLQFPAELNFQPYTKEGIELRQSLGVEYMKSLKDNEEERKKFQELTKHGKDKDYYKLKLKGVIVHSGGPEVGHYWTISKKDASWVKFDDSKVTVFPHSSMESECYGGNFQGDEWGGMGSSTNAYVLLYQKEVKPEIELGEGESKRIIPFDKIETFNCPELYKEVWLDNHSLMLQNHLLKDSFCKQFIHFLVQMLKITPSQSKVQVIAQTLYKVCYHSGQTGKLIEAFMANLDQINNDIFSKYILSDKGRTFDLLFHNNLSVREFTATFIEKVCVESFRKGSQEQKGEVRKLIDEYLLLLHHDVAKNWLRIDGYFKLFQGLVINSVDIPQLYQFLIDKHLIAYFIDFIMQKSSPLTIHPKKYSIGTKSNPAHFGYAIELIFFLIKRSYGFTGENYEIPALNPQELFHLSHNDILCLSSIAFYQKMLRERQNLQFLGLIIQRLSIKNLKFSQAIARVMLITLNQITDAKDEMVDICGCISKYLVIKDEYWVNRAEFVLGYSSPYVYNDNSLASLDEERFVYSSTLEDLFPVECLLAYCHINRLRNPLAVLRILKTVLQGCSVSQTAQQYLLSQRSPTYYHQRYLDWIKPYINTVVQTLNLAKDKKQILLKQIEISNKYIQELQTNKKSIDTIITGKILNCFVVDRFSSQDGSVEVVISNVETYTLKSQPTGHGNAALDQYLDNGRFTKKVTKDSNILCFFKEFSKPLAIKQAVEQAEDKELQSLFDDCIVPRTVQVQNKNNNLSAQITNTKPTQSQVTQASQSDQLPLKQQKQQPVTGQQNIPQVVQEQPDNQKASKQQQKEQQKIQQINIPGVELNPDYFRKIEIINNSNKTKRVTLLFNTNPNSNMLVPSKIYFVSTRKAVQTMWICKVDSTRPWGIVDYQLIVDEKEPKALPKSFQIYGQDQQPKPQPMEIELPDIEPFPQPEQNIQNPVYEQGMMEEIPCPVCTLLNFPTETNCEACGSSLRG